MTLLMSHSLAIAKARAKEHAAAEPISDVALYRAPGGALSVVVTTPTGQRRWLVTPDGTITEEVR